MAPRTEVSSKRAASLASRVLKGYSPNRFETLVLAASVLTQAPDRPKKKVAKKRT